MYIYTASIVAYICVFTSLVLRTEVSCSAAFALAWERELNSKEAAEALLGACVAIIYLAWLSI